MANNIDLTIFALECPLGTFQCSGRLIFRLRTEPAFQAAPVFRMAYFAQKSHRDFCSKTLMLQVRFAHPPNPAPSSRFFVLFRSAYFPSPHRIGFSSRSGVPVGLFGKPKRSCSRFASLTLRTPHRPPVSSPLAAAAALWLPCVRGAVRRQAGLRGCLRIRGKGKGRRPSPVSAPNRLFKLLRCSAWLILQFRTIAHTGAGVPVGLFGKLKRSTSSRFAASIEAHCAVSSETLMLQVRFAHPPNPAPSSRLFSISRRSGLMAPLCKGSCPASSRTEGLPPD